MATIKAIEAHSVHQIQSGQVIVDLCSVVKELVENGLDAGASSVEVRFKNYGFDSIEVQDNGSGISSANYKSVALKHHTSKLSVYDDLSSLQTFGFRGEALSSLCALSKFYMITAQADEAPKGNRLDFETSGELKSTSVVASQRGTIAVVEGIFESLPVRRRELSKNIKREYAKVIGLLHAYACVCTGVKFAAKNTVPAGKSMTVFATNGNSTTRENIANVYGAKTLQALVALDLELDIKPTPTQFSTTDDIATRIVVNGHISRPVWGEGRQSPDRQMFFVNGRPCGLPQVAKAMNEVYKSFNVSQSPFIFADFHMDTNAYDVNVSPDKRTILLHNATDLINKLKESLNTLFENQDQTVPFSQVVGPKLPAFKQLSIQRPEATESAGDSESTLQKTIESSNRLSLGRDHDEKDNAEINSRDVLHDHFRAQVSTREELSIDRQNRVDSMNNQEKGKPTERIMKAMVAQGEALNGVADYDDICEVPDGSENHERNDENGTTTTEAIDINVRDFNTRIRELQGVRKASATSNFEASPIPPRSPDTAAFNDSDEPDRPNIVQNAFDRMRPKRAEAEIATITIGDQTTKKIVGSSSPATHIARLSSQPVKQANKVKGKSSSTLQFSQSLRRFGAEGLPPEEEFTGPSNPQTQNLSDLKDIDTESSDQDASVNLDNETEPYPGRANMDEEDSDPDFIDQTVEQAEERARVAELIRLAEERAARPTEENLSRANKALRASQSKDSTVRFQAYLDFALESVQNDAEMLHHATLQDSRKGYHIENDVDKSDVSDEEKLSLAVARSDFANMEIIGQFNLGFILAVRKPREAAENTPMPPTTTLRDELFIIDQHASDEKYNFERLQATTIVSNQRLVRPIILDLTAVEEEIVLANIPALEKNGFVVKTDTSGDSPIGQRCKLLTLPLSKEVTFNTLDLEELIHLLAESPSLNEESQVPRPAKVRKMFAMRACRSSIMIGKTLTRRRMEEVVRHMGEINKPWNCPHGRPTMRHLTNLNVLTTWKEGDGLTGEMRDDTKIWREYSGG